MKVLICPLNWGLGHATRCVPIVQKYQSEGHQVTIAAEGKALKFLIQYFQDIPFVTSTSFSIRYSARKTQFWVMFLLNMISLAV